MHYHTYCFPFHIHRQNTVLVSADDIIITSVEQTDDGLQVIFFVRGGSGDTSGVIPVEAVIEAVQVRTGAGNRPRLRNRLLLTSNRLIID